MESADVNHAGSLRFQSLLLYGVTHQESRNESWRPLLAKMTTCRENLRNRYPLAVEQTASAWNKFSGYLQKSGQVDWMTALAMRDSADRLTQSIEDKARSKHDRANVLFLVMIAATIFFAGFALAGTRSSQRTEQARTRAEAELREVTALRRAILDSADYTIISTDVQGTIVTFNHAAERLLGYSAEEIVGKVSPGIFHDPAEVAARAEYLTKKLGRYVAPGFEVFTAEIKEDGSDENEWTYLCKDGSSFPVRLSATALRDEAGALTGYLGIAQDITERKKAEEAIRTSEARLRDAQRVAKIGSWERDYRTGAIYWSEEMFRIYGFDARQGIPSVETILSRVHPEDAAKYYAAIKSSLTEGTIQTLDCRIYDQYDSLKWGQIVASTIHDEYGNVIKTFGTVTDITERKKAEIAYREQEQFVSAVLNTAGALVIVLDINGHIVRFNRACERATGWTFAEVEGKLFQSMFELPEAVTGVRNAFAQVSASDFPLQFEHDWVTKGGERRRIAFANTALFHEDGTVNVIIATGIDVTEQRAAEATIRKSEERLKEAQQVAQLGSWEYDIETYKISWSPELFRLLDLDPAQGEPDYEANLALYHPEDAARLDNCVKQAVAEGKDYALDLRRISNEGQNPRWYHGVGKVVRDVHGKVTQLVGTLADITERKATEEAVRENQTRLNHAQAMAHVGSWERDYRTGTMSWSDEMFRLCGLEPGSITPSIEALMLHTHPLDRRRAQDCMKRAMQDGVGAELELRLVGADGTLRYVFIRTEILKDEAGRNVGSRATVTDVTERVQALQEQTKFVSLIENSSDFIAMATLDGVLVSMNPAGRALVGLEREAEVTTTMLPDFIPAEIWAIMRQEALPMVMRDDHWKGESQLINVLTGAVHDMQASLFLIRNPVSGEPMCLATVQHDITEQKWMDTQLQQNLVIVQNQNVELEEQQHELAKANRHLEALATTDGLTGAKNHRAFQEKLTEEFKRAERNLQSFSIILLDVDKFKQYNDTYGHPEGDRVLKEIVRVLQETARETDFVARYGGEEFIILLPETGKEGAMEAAERFRAAIEIQDWPLRPVTASFGAASLSAATGACQDLVEMADKALYASKAGGRNRVSHADIQAEPILSEL